MKYFGIRSRLVRIVLLAVMLLCIIHSVGITAKASHLYYTITNFYPTSTFPWVTWDLCNHPGGSYPYVAPPGYGYYEVNYNVNAGNIVTTSFTATGVSFSSSKVFSADYSGVIGDMLPAPAFSLPADSTFTVIVTLYQNKMQWKAGTMLMRQKIKLNCTTRVITSNIITYH